MSFNIDLEAIDREVNTNSYSNSYRGRDNSRFNVNLESIMEDEEIRNDPVYTNLATAITVGKAVNKLLQEREMQRLEEVRG